jgi:hypothetical protein
MYHHRFPPALPPALLLHSSRPALLSPCTPLALHSSRPALLSPCPPLALHSSRLHSSRPALLSPCTPFALHSFCHAPLLPCPHLALYVAPCSALLFVLPAPRPCQLVRLSCPLALQTLLCPALSLSPLPSCPGLPLALVSLLHCPSLACPSFVLLSSCPSCPLSFPCLSHLTCLS